MSFADDSVPDVDELPLEARPELTLTLRPDDYGLIRALSRRLGLEPASVVRVALVALADAPPRRMVGPERGFFDARRGRG